MLSYTDDLRGRSSAWSHQERQPGACTSCIWKWGVAGKPLIDHFCWRTCSLSAEPSQHLLVEASSLLMRAFEVTRGPCNACG